MAHACNPSYSGGRDQKVRRIAVWSQPRQIVLETLSQKKKSQKKGLVEWAQGVVPQFKHHLTPIHLFNKAMLSDRGRECKFWSQSIAFKSWHCHYRRKGGPGQVTLPFQASVTHVYLIELIVHRGDAKNEEDIVLDALRTVPFTLRVLSSCEPFYHLLGFFLGTSEAMVTRMSWPQQQESNS
jgi:hypothetical protein